MMCRVLWVMVLSLCVALGMMTNPKIILSPSRIMVAVGSSVQLQCAIVNGSVQHLGVTWNMVTSASSPEILTHSQSDGVTKVHSNNKKFQSFRDLRHSSYILTIKDIETSDNRQYYCDIVGKNMPTSSQRITVSVQGKSFPVLTQTPILNVTVSQTAQLHCSMQNIDLGVTDVHWYRRSLAGYQWIVTHRVSGNVLVNEDFQGHFNSTRNNSGLVATLIITNIQPEDATVYYCNVWSNVYGTGAQLNIIKAESQDLFPIILGCVLCILVLLVIAVIVVLCVKQWACFRTASTPNRDTNEGNDIVYATASGRTPASNLPAAVPVGEDDGQVHYAELQLRQVTQRPPRTQTVTDPDSEYAAVKHT
ncbi:uncharacterized protein LOC132819294 isoform X2 [Hemiscyllium ocellatum]|uniref:uncharacterized protein LOC132819294 isoform X2 n=1 Tax=Hemiscyllium ocellatum TaxID=170820 RepID=UPI00296774AF|nr:uncharacterized protein LOC132819294 isoform X2 [Hemiscyllium ocellatum]